ncbi:hypothetical protein CALVIDRAFT_531618 [Calocera viscosa TUFC12733]|uniref:Uncharacterized protein n=1 Tax=Calocera viscosa (strain TUFC12733) TaxID=1330018 RepID=A0A167G597_CALVF|nr:hypothetical protein CALVIDRAFT_531618 [Calocera viscosa TUFC12733]
MEQINRLLPSHPAALSLCLLSTATPADHSSAANANSIAAQEKLSRKQHKLLEKTAKPERALDTLGFCSYSRRLVLEEPAYQQWFTPHDEQAAFKLLYTAYDQPPSALTEHSPSPYSSTSYSHMPSILMPTPSPQQSMPSWQTDVLPGGYNDRQGDVPVRHTRSTEGTSSTRAWRASTPWPHKVSAPQGFCYQLPFKPYQGTLHLALLHHATEGSTPPSTGRRERWWDVKDNEETAVDSEATAITSGKWSDKALEEAAPPKEQHSRWDETPSIQVKVEEGTPVATTAAAAAGTRCPWNHQNTSDEELDILLSPTRYAIIQLLPRSSKVHRKTALRQIPDKVSEFGAALLFDKILSQVMERTVEDQERHLLLNNLIRPYVHRILLVVEHLLVDEDYYAPVEGRQIIFTPPRQLACIQARFAHDCVDVLRGLLRPMNSVAASPPLHYQQEQRSWRLLHACIRIVRQIAITMSPTFPAKLATAPYRIKTFNAVLKPLWLGIHQHRGKGLVPFLKSYQVHHTPDGPKYAFYDTKLIIVIWIHEGSDEMMKKIILKVVKQCVAMDRVTPACIKHDILPEFLKVFGVQRMALDQKNLKQMVETKVELAQRAGIAQITDRTVNVEMVAVILDHANAHCCNMCCIGHGG